MFDRVAETGIRKCVICGKFLPRFMFEECVCSCGAYYAMRESL